MTRTAIIALAGAALAATILPGAASAQSQGRFFDPARQAPPLVVRGRPFTDSGTVVPYGYDQSNLISQTVVHRPVYSSFRPDDFGQDVLPRPFDGLGLY